MSSGELCMQKIRAFYYLDSTERDTSFSYKSQIQTHLKEPNCYSIQCQAEDMKFSFSLVPFIIMNMFSNHNFGITETET